MEELFGAAKEDATYQEALAFRKNGATKEQLQQLPLDHPARAMAQQWKEISIIQRRKDRLMIYQGTRIVVPAPAQGRI